MKKAIAARLAFVLFSLSSCPAAAAESYSAGLARIQHPKIRRAEERVGKASELGDYETACSEARTVVMLTRWNLDGLEQIMPSIDWMDHLQDWRAIEKVTCALSQ